ncbi:MAG: hypothetical protein Q4B54_01155 [Coriobacteriales bacterium]|nr:hypothetical protein [Coriobacteriales bacterium]
MRGLLGTDCSAEPVALVPCSSIHTWGMRYYIDVALVSANGVVLKACRAVPPARLVSAPGARYALERPCSRDVWPETGSLVSIAVESTAKSVCPGAAITEP